MRCRSSAKSIIMMAFFLTMPTSMMTPTKAYKLRSTLNSNKVSNAPVSYTHLLFSVEQLIAPGAVAARPLLPSVRYHPTAGELAAADVRLPWDFIDPGAVSDSVLGELARERGSRAPGRLVASAKSCLLYTSRCV